MMRLGSVRARSDYGIESGFKAKPESLRDQERSHVRLRIKIPEIDKNLVEDIISETTGLPENADLIPSLQPAQIRKHSRDVTELDLMRRKTLLQTRERIDRKMILVNAQKVLIPAELKIIRKKIF